MRKLVVLTTATGDQGRYDAYWLCYVCKNPNLIGDMCQIRLHRHDYHCPRCKTAITIDWEKIRQPEDRFNRYYSHDDLRKFLVPVSQKVQRKYTREMQAFDKEKHFGIDKVYGLEVWVHFLSSEG